MFKVVITDYIGPEVEVEKSIIGDLAEIKPLLARSLDELEGKVDDADAIIIFHEVSLPETVISRLSNCRIIVRGGVGYDAVDFALQVSKVFRFAIFQTMELMKLLIRR